MTITTLAFVGDSLTHGLNGGYSTYSGGRGSWFEQTIEELATTLNVPRISSGFRGVGIAFIGPNDEVTYTTGGNAWTNVATTDAFDRTPAGQAKYGSGVNKTVTFKPKTTGSMGPRPVVGFALYWVNLTGGGDWQYRIDGGTWTNMGQTLGGATANKLCKFYVATAVNQTVECRCYNGSSDVTAMPVGVEWFWTNPVGLTSGLIGHNYGLGSQSLHNIVLATSGDRLACLDSVQLGSGSPPSSTPNAGTILLAGNDAIANGGTTPYATDMTTLYTRASPLGPVGFINPYEFDYGFATSAIQTSYRAQQTTTGGSLGAKLLDLFVDYQNRGYGAAGAQNALLLAGLYTTDGTHPNQQGHNDLTPKIYWWLRNQFFGLGAVQARYTVAGTQAAVAYSGTRAAVVYSAGLPISI